MKKAKFSSVLLLILGHLTLFSQQYAVIMSDSSLSIVNESTIIPNVKSELFVNKSTSSGEIFLDGNFARISLNNLQIGDLGGNELGLDGDIVPYASTTFDLGNNVVGEHWDQVVANTFVTYSPPLGILKSKYKSFDGALEAILSLTPYKSILDNKQMIFEVENLKNYLPEVLVLSDHDKGSDNKKIAKNPGINYDAFIPILVRALQEQQDQIQSLKVELSALTNQ